MVCPGISTLPRGPAVCLLLLPVYLAIKVCLVNSAAQPQVATATMGGDADVVFLRARYLAIRSQRIHHILAVVDVSPLNTCEEVLRYPELLLRARTGTMAELYRHSSGRVVRSRPIVFRIDDVAPVNEIFLPAGRRDIQALARLEIHPGCQDMHMDALALLRVLTIAGMPVVPHCSPGVTVRLQARPGVLLEAVQHPVDLVRRRLVVRRPGDDRAGEPVLKRQ